MDRAERRRRTAVIVARRIEEMQGTYMFEWIDARYIGRCRNMSPFDCGRSHCGVCGSSKRWFAGISRKEQVAELNYKEELGEWQYG